MSPGASKKTSHFDCCWASKIQQLAEFNGPESPGLPSAGQTVQQDVDRAGLQRPQAYGVLDGLCCSMQAEQDSIGPRPTECWIECAAACRESRFILHRSEAYTVLDRRCGRMKGEQGDTL